MPEGLHTRLSGEIPLDRVINEMPVAAYITDAAGRIKSFNRAAVMLWGREPATDCEHWCGSLRLFDSDGKPMRHEECPMARALRSGSTIAGAQASLERPDGNRVHFLAYPTVLRDDSGNVIGAVNILIDVTDRIEAQEALRRREAELTDFFENSTIGLHWVGPDGTIIWANRAELGMLGYTAEEYVGRNIMEFHADQEVIDDILARLTRFETLKNYPARMRARDGSIRHVLIDSSAYTEDGRFVHTRCFTRDVSAQKMIEERLNVSAAISEILSVAATLDEAAPRVLEKLSAHFDADIVELWIGKSALRCAFFYSRLPEADVHEFKAAAERAAFALGEGLPGLVWQNRAPMWLSEVSSAPEFARRDEAEKIGLGTSYAIPILFGHDCLGVIACHMRRSLPHDRSLLRLASTTGHKLGQFIERIGAEETNRYLAAVTHASVDAIFSLSPEGIIASWNEGAVDLYGYEAEEAIGQPVSLIAAKENLAEYQRSLACLASGQGVEPFETVALTKGGEPIPVSLSLSAVQDFSDRLVAVAAIARDISDRKAAEAQLERRIRQLEAVSALGIMALTNENLDEVLQNAVKYIAEGLSVELVKVLELLPGGVELLLRAGTGWRSGLVGRARMSAGAASQAGYTLSIAEPVVVEDLDAETRFSPPSLLVDHGVTSGLSVVIYGEGGKPFGALGAHTRHRRNFTAYDVSFLQSIANILSSAVTAKAQRERQTILLQELSHRVKNTLAVIQAIASQSSSQAGSIDEFRESFEGRIAALARAHEALTKSNWNGARLSDIAERVFGGQTELDRVQMELEDFDVGPAAAQSLTLVLHELTTNALKYGSLSGESGTVSLQGKFEKANGKHVYSVTWRETGGPPICEPEHTGYGTRLIKGVIAHRFGGEVAMSWDRDGLGVTLKIDADRMG